MADPLPVPPDLAPVVLEAFDLAIADLRRKIGEPRVYRVVEHDVAGLQAKVGELEAARDLLAGTWAG